MKYIRIKDYYCDYETQIVPLNYELIADILTCFADNKPFVKYDNKGNKLSEKYEVKINGFLIKVIDKCY